MQRAKDKMENRMPGGSLDPLFDDFQKSFLNPVVTPVVPMVALWPINNYSSLPKIIPPPPNVAGIVYTPAAFV